MEQQGETRHLRKDFGRTAHSKHAIRLIFEVVLRQRGKSDSIKTLRSLIEVDDIGQVFITIDSHCQPEESDEQRSCQQHIMLY